MYESQPLHGSFNTTSPVPNTLIASNQGNIVEVNKEGKTVWEVTQKDLPDFKLFIPQVAVRLELQAPLADTTNLKLRDGFSARVIAFMYGSHGLLGHARIFQLMGVFKI